MSLELLNLELCKPLRWLPWETKLLAPRQLKLLLKATKVVDWSCAGSLQAMLRRLVSSLRTQLEQLMMDNKVRFKVTWLLGKG